MGIIDDTYAPTSQARALVEIVAAAGDWPAAAFDPGAAGLCALNAWAQQHLRGSQGGERMQAASLEHYRALDARFRASQRQGVLQLFAQMGDVGTQNRRIANTIIF